MDNIYDVPRLHSAVLGYKSNKRKVCSLSEDNSARYYKNRHPRLKMAICFKIKNNSQLAENSQMVQISAY